MAASREVLPSLFSRSCSYTHFDVLKFTHVWNIKNFSVYPSRVYLRSSVFPDGENDNIKWRLEMAKEGLNEKKKDHLLLFLRLYKSNEIPLTASFILSILDSNGREKNTRYGGRVFPGEQTTCGFSQFIQIGMLYERAYGLLTDDTLKIFCEVRVLKGVETKYYMPEEIKVRTADSHLSDDLALLFQTKKYCDVKLCASGQVFHAHRAILAARSPVFAAIFEQRVSNGKKLKMRIPEIEPEVLAETLYFIYTGVSPNLKNITDKLLSAADKYRLKTLKNMCEEVLVTRLSVGSAAALLRMADQYSADQLKKHSIHFIIHHAEKVVDTEGWEAIMKTHPHLVSEAFRALAKLRVPATPHLRAE